MPILLQYISAEEHSKSVALVNLAATNQICRFWTYQTLYEQVEAAAKRIVSYGVVTGSIVSIAIPNSLEFIICFLAVTAIGAVAAPLNPNYKTNEFSFFMVDSRSQFLIVNKDGNAIAEEVAKSLQISILEISTSDNECLVCIKDKLMLKKVKSVFEKDTVESFEHPTSDDICLLVHTSGTTSRPKAVPLTHNNICTTVKNIISTYNLSPNDCTLLVMPLFHVHGLICALLSTLGSGGKLVIPSTGCFSASRFWLEAVENEITWFTAVPTILRVLLMRAAAEYPKDNPPKLRFIRSCSASLPAALVPALEEAFNTPVLEAYAMSEAAHQMTSNPLPENGPRKPGSVGIGQNVEIQIWTDSCQTVETGTVGEVVIRGKNVMSGYLYNEEANVIAFKGGWFHTGDLGFLDSDKYLTLVGRQKELINRGGEKISPEEIDHLLMEHPSVFEAVTFSAPDEKYGEQVNCAVVLLSTHNSTTAEDLINFCKSKVVAFKIPSKIFIVPELPKSATGKLQRRLVAEYFLAQK